LALLRKAVSEIGEEFERNLQQDSVREYIRHNLTLQVFNNAITYNNSTVMNPEGASMGKRTTDVSGVGHSIGGDNSTVAGAKIDRTQVAVGEAGGQSHRTLIWTSITAIIVAVVGALSVVAGAVYNKADPATVDPAPMLTPTVQHTDTVVPISHPNEPALVLPVQPDRSFQGPIDAPVYP